VQFRLFAAVVLALLLQSASARAQFIGGTNFNGTDSLVATWSGKGPAMSVGFAALGNDMNKPYVGPPALDNLVGIVQMVLGSSTACAFATPDYRWTMVPNSEAVAKGLCQVLYYRRFGPDEKPPYRFRWFVTLPYDVRTYVISNVSAVDKASSNSGTGTVMTAPGVTTTEVGDYLMAFYVNSGKGTWVPPPSMGIAVRNDYGLYGPPTFPNLATQAWSIPVAPTGNKVATVSGGQVEWLADLVAFKPLYKIPPQTVGDLNPGSIYNGCKGKVTLASGEGTFGNSCVKATSFCQCRDTTKIDDLCYTANPIPGSVRLKGAGTDVELVNCM
jgi:hypothetical protein